MDAHLHMVNVSCIRQQHRILTQFSLHIKNSELLLIEGENGAGKSTLLRLLAGLMTPNQGDIFWQNKSIGDKHLNYPQQLHYIGHLNGIKLGLTVQENLNLLQTLQFNLTKTMTDDFVLAELKLEKYKAVPAKHLSAGQKRRLALAKLLLYPKKIWLLDEPLTALDTTTQHLFLKYLKIHLENEGIAAISSHQTTLFDALPKQHLRLAAC